MSPAQREAELLAYRANHPPTPDDLAKAAMRRLRASITRSANKHLREMGLKPSAQKALPL